jgi:hypothetical protein
MNDEAATSAPSWQHAIARPVFAPRPSLRVDLHLGISSAELGVAASVPELKEARNHRFRHCPDASRQHGLQPQWSCGNRESGLHKWKPPPM